MSNRQIERPPNKHLVAFLTFIGLLPLVYLIPGWIMENISTDNRVVTLIAVAVIVPIISYVFLPVCFWAIAKFHR